MITILNKEIAAHALGELNPGEKAEITGFSSPSVENEGFLHRLFEVGFLVGSELEVLQQAPYSGDPISIRIKEATYALRRAEANLIHVRKL